MKYLLSGLFIGAILSLLVFQGVSASELHTGYYLDLAELDNIQPAISENSSDFYVVPRNDKMFLLSGEGVPAKIIEMKDSLMEFSGNGRYYIQYGKVGTAIELLGFNGERYWKLSSREKPFLSRNGKLVLLLIGDHSRVRMFDTNGNQTGVKEISGRLCTTIEFSEENDFACFGFADGTYFFLDEKGNVLNKGSLPGGNIVKGMRLSSNGKYGVVHYGTDQKDGVRVVNIPDNDFEDEELGACHVMKTALHADNDGLISVLDNEAFIVFDEDADEVFKVRIPPKRPGQAAITKLGEYFFLAYTKATGESQLYVITGDGRFFYSREFAGESYLAAAVRDESVIVRGSDSLFSYKIHVPGK